MSITYFSVSLTNNSNSRATIVVLTTTSSTVKINDNSKTNISKQTKLFNARQEYCCQRLGMVGVLCGYYIRFEYFDTIH